MKPIIIPVITQRSEIDIADVLKVQPMSAPTGKIFTLKIVSASDYPPSEGKRRHCILNGWEVFYHGEWISESTWITLKIKGL